MVITLVGSLLWKFNVWHTDLDSLPAAHGSLISDNRGNIFALLNQKTEQMPTSAFLMQLIVMLHRAGFRLAPSHMKREYNQWADELTHPHFTGFRPDRQLPVSEAFSNFKFLWSLLDNQPLGQPKVQWSLAVAAVFYFAVVVWTLGTCSTYRASLWLRRSGGHAVWHHH